MPATDVIEQLRAALEGRYAVEREIGEGGMATVYLARDLKHDRPVALKLLKAELGAMLGVERFLAEIRVTANLQHPNLLPLFDSGEAAGMLFYVMPFVEGESLRARLDRETLLPVDEAIRIATALAGALDYAHRQNVIHRDLKPENILLHEGQPLIADFGIALAVSKAGGARMTQTGLSIGTPQYMSPEQAMGERVIDGRSDIYSLAAVTYELLTGEPPHTGATAQAIVARVLTDKPRSIRASRDTVPEYVDLAIDRALAKLPADRWSTAREFGEALNNPLAMSKSAAVFGAAAAAQMRSLRMRLRRGVPWILAFAGVAAAAIAWWGAGRRAGSAAVLRVSLNFDPGVEVATATGSPFSLSPDGTWLAFVATKNGGAQRLFVRSLAELEAREIGGTEEAQQPFFSPDGKWVGFLAQQKLKKVSVAGGMPVPLGDVPSQMHGASWGSRGEIVISTRGALAAIPEAGGAFRAIAAPDTVAGEIGKRFPRLLGDGKTVLYESWNQSGLAAARIGLASLDGAKGRILDLAGSYPIGVIDGYLVYGTSPNSIMAVPFDVRKGIATGAPTLVIDGAAVGTAGAMKGSLSTSGALVYASSRLAEQLVLTDRRGLVRVLLAEARHYESPRFSPDGRRVALTVQSATSADIYLFDVASGALTRFTTEGRLNDYAEWTPDGKRVLFASNRNGASALWWGPVDMSQPAERLMGSPTRSVYEGVVSPDGRLLVAQLQGAKGLNDLAYRSLIGDTATKTIVSSAEPKYSPRVSPDGRWVAYSSSALGTRQVFVTPMPGPGPRVQVSTDGGEAPAWSADGRQLYYVHAKQLIAATLVPGEEFAVASRATALDGGFNIGGQGFHANYDVSRDGTQFLVLRPVSGSVSVIFVHNWTNELRARMAASAAK